MFGATESTKNTDPDKYGYSSYGTGFDEGSQFSIPSGEWFLVLKLFYHCMLILEKKDIVVPGKDQQLDSIAIQ